MGELMKTKLIVGILILAFLFCATFVFASLNIVYSLSLKYDGKQLTNEGLKLIEGQPPTRADQPENGFTLKVIDINGKELYSFKFLIDTRLIREAPPEIFDETGKQIAVPEEQPTKLEQVTTTLIIPYFENAKSIEIYDDKNTLLLSVDVSKYSTQRPNPQIFSLLFILVGLTFLALIGFVVFRIKKPKYHKEHIKTNEKIKEHKTVHKKIESKTKYCADCGHQLSENSKYCAGCGAKVQKE